MRRRLRPAALAALLLVLAAVGVGIDRAALTTAEQTASAAPIADGPAAPRADVGVGPAPNPQPAESSSIPAHPTGPATADAPDQPGSVADADPAPGQRLAALERRARAGDRKAARDWVDAIGECGAAVDGERIASTSAHVAYLNPDTRQAEHALRTELLGGLIDECRQLFPAMDDDKMALHFQSLLRQAFGLWAASGDPFGQLLASQQELIWPPPLAQWQQQQAWAGAYLNPQDPQTLVDLAEAFAYGSRYPFQEAWRLAACDLGYDCAADGALQRRLCLVGAPCSQLGYEQELLQTLPPRHWQIVQRQRRELLELLRHGDARSLFDVPPPGP